MKTTAWKLAALAVALAVPAMAETPAVNFDQWVDAGALLQKARSDAKDGKAQYREYGPGRYGPAYRPPDRDCARFDFEPGGPSVSPTQTLRSTVYRQECRWVGDPRRGGYRDCWDRPGWTYAERATVEIAGPQPVHPWERQSFEVCLEGNWLSFHTIAAAYDYKVSGGGYYTLVPGKRVPMDPDPAGLTASDLVNAGTAFAMDVSDRWASYYAGETTRLHVALFKDVPGWRNDQVFEADVDFPAAGSYHVDFAGFKPKLEAGKSYYVKWGFKRLGKVSRPSFVKRGETGKTVFAPATAGL